ncbi:MAG: hypothetical protein HOW73_05615 [Polyangiaceae bacterium]|nr:hypothetical protein [Polyangiaceae bacterium]
MVKKKGGKQQRGGQGPTAKGGSKSAPPPRPVSGAPPAQPESAAKPAETEEVSPPAASVDVDRPDDEPKKKDHVEDNVAKGPEYAAPGSSAPPSSTAVQKEAGPPLARAAWGKPFVTIERWWTWFEVRLLVVVILGLVFSMVLWVSLQGMSAPVESESKAGLVFRGIVGAIAIGLAAWLGTGKLGLDRMKRTIAAMAGIAVGAAIAPSWRHAGVDYFGNVQNWLQEGSSLTMFGQLRGVSTRLTVVLAFIGGSLAAASGKHINIDVALRFVKDRFKLPVFVLQTAATVVFCVVAGLAFFEYIAITNFNAKPESTRSEKYKVVDDAVAQDLFLWRKQIGFDLSATTHVLGGGKWDDAERLSGRQWNEFLETSGYRDYFTPEQVQSLKSPDEYLDESRLPLAVGPEGPPRNLLVRTMNLTFAAGFFFMALRFLLRLILVLSGHQSIEPESDYDPDADPKRHAEREHAGDVAAHDAGSKDSPSGGEVA